MEPRNDSQRSTSSRGSSGVEWPDDWAIQSNDPKEDSYEQPCLALGRIVSACSGRDIYVARNAAASTTSGFSSSKKILAILPGMLSFHNHQVKKKLDDETTVPPSTAANIATSSDETMEAKTETTKMAASVDDKDDEENLQLNETEILNEKNAEKETKRAAVAAPNDPFSSAVGVTRKPSSESPAVIGRLHGALSNHPVLHLILSESSSSNPSSPSTLQLTGQRINASSKFMMLTLHPKGKVVCKSIFSQVVVFGNAQISPPSSSTLVGQNSSEETTIADKACPVQQTLTHYGASLRAEKGISNEESYFAAQPTEEKDNIDGQDHSPPALLATKDSRNKRKINSSIAKTAASKRQQHRDSDDEDGESDDSSLLEPPENDSMKESDDEFNISIDLNTSLTARRSSAPRSTRNKKVVYKDWVNDGGEEEKDEEDEADEVDKSGSEKKKDDDDDRVEILTRKPPRKASSKKTNASVSANQKGRRRPTAVQKSKIDEDDGSDGSTSSVELASATFSSKKKKASVKVSTAVGSASARTEKTVSRTLPASDSESKEFSASEREDDDDDEYKADKSIEPATAAARSRPRRASRARKNMKDDSDSAESDNADDENEPKISDQKYNSSRRATKQLPPSRSKRAKTVEKNLPKMVVDIAEDQEGDSSDSVDEKDESKKAGSRKEINVTTMQSPLRGSRASMRKNSEKARAGGGNSFGKPLTAKDAEASSSEKDAGSCLVVEEERDEASISVKKRPAQYSDKRSPKGTETTPEATIEANSKPANDASSSSNKRRKAEAGRSILESLTVTEVISNVKNSPTSPATPTGKKRRMPSLSFTPGSLASVSSGDTGRRRRRGNKKVAASPADLLNMDDEEFKLDVK